jgi:hypothetical protein
VTPITAFTATSAVCADVDVRAADLWVNLFNVNLEKIMPNSFTEDDIRTKAYELWEQAGCPDGGAGIYWAQAQVILGNGESASPSDSLADVHSPEDTPDGK